MNLLQLAQCKRWLNMNSDLIVNLADIFLNIKLFFKSLITFFAFLTNFLDFMSLKLREKYKISQFPHVCKFSIVINIIISSSNIKVT